MTELGKTSSPPPHRKITSHAGSQNAQNSTNKQRSRRSVGLQRGAGAQRGNYAFIDGQNLKLGITRANPPWDIDYQKFRKYLAEKYHVTKAYYFLGVYYPRLQDLYDDLTTSGFELVFRKHDPKSTSAKKGNVDTDVVLYMLYAIIKKAPFRQVILISGDGDYYKTVMALIHEKRFGRLLAPSRRSISSLYRLLSPQYLTFLDDPLAKSKIIYKRSSSRRKR